MPARTATLERDHARLAAQVAALQARHAFEKVIADAPASSDAVKARARLADLDRSAH